MSSSPPRPTSPTRSHAKSYKSFQSAGFYSCLEEDDVSIRGIRNQDDDDDEEDEDEARSTVSANANTHRWTETTTRHFLHEAEQDWGIHNSATVIFHGLTVQNPYGGQPLLKDVSGILLPGKVTALLGSSDTEINALITLLAGVLNKEEYSGSVYYNKIPISAWYRRTVVGFARANGVFCSRSLTVRQNLLLSIQLHLQINSVDQALAVDRVIALVGLQDHERDTVSTLNSEAKLRMTIAQELLIDPTVLFVESPTTGLSYAASLSIMKLLRHIAVSQGKTVVVSLHQPRWAVYNLVDHLALIHGGQLAYFGKAGEDAIEFFQTRGMIWNRQYTPTDFLLQLCSTSVTNCKISTSCNLLAHASDGSREEESSFDEDSEALTPAPAKTDAQILGENFQTSVEYRSFILPHILEVVEESSRILRCTAAAAPQLPPTALHNKKKTGLLRDKDSKRSKTAKIQETPALKNSFSKTPGEFAPLPRMVKTRESWERTPDGGSLTGNSHTGNSQVSRSHLDYGTSGMGRPASLSRDVLTPLSAAGDQYVAEYAPFKEPSEVKRLLILLHCNVLRSLAYWKWYFLNIVLISSASFAIGNLYNISTNNQRALQNRVGVVFFTVMVQMLLNVPAASSLVRHRPVFLHQRASGSYGTVTYWMSTVIWELLIKRILMTLICALVVNQFVEFNGGYGKLAGVLVVTQASFYILVLAIGSVVTSVTVSATVLYALFAFFTVTGGLLINSQSIPQFMQWVQLLSYFRYSYESLLTVLFHDQEFNCVPKTGCYDGNAYLTLQGFDIDHAWHNIHVLLVSSAVFLLISLVAMWLSKPPLVVARPHKTWYLSLFEAVTQLYTLTVRELPRKLKTCGSG